MGNGNQFHVVGTYCGGAYHVTAGIYNSAFAGVGDYERCNYWIQCGGGDGFSSHLHVAAGQRMMADARARGMKVVCVEPVFQLQPPKRMNGSRSGRLVIGTLFWVCATH